VAGSRRRSPAESVRSARSPLWFRVVRGSGVPSGRQRAPAIRMGLTTSSSISSCSTRLVRDAAGLTAANPAILWRYAGTLSMRLSRCRTRPGAELHGAGRHHADTAARRAQERPLAEAESGSSGAAATQATAAGSESVTANTPRTAQQDTRTSQQDTRTRCLNRRARTAADRARCQQRWPYSSGIATGANRHDRPDAVSGGGL
jgi:hypothetical protein